MAITYTLTRRDSRAFATANGTVTFTARVGARGADGADGADGAAGPNQISDATALGTLTENVTAGLRLLATNAAGTLARAITPTATGLSFLLAANNAAVLALLGTGTPGSGNFLRGDGSWQAASGGSAGDLLSTLTAAEISVTGATTATVSRMHVCSGTSADYTVTLPAASGNAGKLIGFRMSPALTRFVTLDGNASETIDGATTRVMWAQETAILLCDGSNWFKVAGRSIPLLCSIANTGGGTQSIGNNSVTQVTLPNTLADNSGRMADTASNRIVPKRAGTYLSQGQVAYSSFPANALCQSRVHVNGSVAQVAKQTLGVTEFPAPFSFGPITLAVGDLVTLHGYQLAGSTQAIAQFSDGSTSLRLIEVPAW